MSSDELVNDVNKAKQLISRVIDTNEPFQIPEDGLFVCAVLNRQAAEISRLREERALLPQSDVMLQKWNDPQWRSWAKQWSENEYSLIEQHVAMLTERTMHQAWRKRAEEAEAEITRLRHEVEMISEVRRQVGKIKPHLPLDISRPQVSVIDYCDGFSAAVEAAMSVLADTLTAKDGV